MTQETPAKIFSLLGVAMFSLFFLFGVSVSNASFNRTETVLPDLFNPDNIVSMLDNVSNSYSKFVNQQLVQPGVESYAMVMDNVNYVMDEASPQILAVTGFGSIVDSPSSQSQVAGAFTNADNRSEASIPAVNVDSVYSLIRRE